MSAEQVLKELLDSLPAEHHERAGIIRSMEVLRCEPESKPMLMIAALYDIPSPYGDSSVTVCLGLRIGDPDNIVRLTKLLVKQVRERYPEFFAGMKPKEVEAACRWSVYETEPTRYGFPQFLGGVEWWG